MELEFKVSKKGCLCVYGLNQLPTALYKDQWEKIIANVDMLKAFMQEHDAELKTKEESKQG